jgi:hypothetical protein
MIISTSNRRGSIFDAGGAYSVGMDAIDVLENVLVARGPSGIRTPLHATAASSLAGLSEFASVRRFWWLQHREDLVRVLPAAQATWERLCSPEEGLVHPFANDHGEIHNVPGVNAGWEPGDPFMRFQERFKTALVRAGAPSTFAFMVLGAFNEMASNAAEHSKALVTSVASYEVMDGRWSFSATDVGCGLLRSLQLNPNYTALADEASAVPLAIQDGVSSTGKSSRGFGFTKVFKVLVDRACSIRFRSAGAAATWSGTSPTASQLTITVSPPRCGFHVQVAGSL